MHGLTVNRNIDAFGLGCPDSSWDKIANFTGKSGRLCLPWSPINATRSALYIDHCIPSSGELPCSPLT